MATRSGAIPPGGRCSCEIRLLAYYDVPISTGPLEGTNHKVKTLQRQAYGYRHQEFFHLRILSLHETRYELLG